MSFSADRGSMEAVCNVAGNVGDEVDAFACSSGFSPLMASAFWIFLVLALFLLLWARLINQAWGKKLLLIMNGEKSGMLLVIRH